MTECTCQHPQVEEEPQLVKVQGSDIYFHCEVDVFSVLELKMKLKKLEVDLLKKAQSEGVREREAIAAEYHDGILEVKVPLPVMTAPSPTRIPVQRA